MASGVVMILLATTDAESRDHLRPASMLAIHRQTTTPSNGPSILNVAATTAANNATRQPMTWRSVRA